MQQWVDNANLVYTFPVAHAPGARRSNSKIRVLQLSGRVVGTEAYQEVHDGCDLELTRRAPDRYIARALQFPDIIVEAVSRTAAHPLAPANAPGHGRCARMAGADAGLVALR